MLAPPCKVVIYTGDQKCTRLNERFCTSLNWHLYVLPRLALEGSDKCACTRGKRPKRPRGASRRSWTYRKAEAPCLALTSAGRPESKASFQLSTEGLKRPRGAGRRSWTYRKAEAARSDSTRTGASDKKTLFVFLRGGEVTRESSRRS